MEVAIIVAMTPQGLIGKNNQLPWHLPADLQRFKKITIGHPIVMGRKTFESLPGVLPGRQHIVLTRDKNYQADECDVVTNWQQVKIAALDAAIVYVIGGADIYEYALPVAKYLNITIVHAELNGDTYFPDWDQSKWKELDREYRVKDEKNIFDIEFVQYVRNQEVSINNN